MNWLPLIEDITVESHSFINELILIFAASVVVAALFNRLKVPTIVCYLLVGAILGPGLGAVTDIGAFQVVAEFGVAFLLFTLGLEFSLPRLLALRRVVFGMGSLQVVVSIAFFGALLYATRDIYAITLVGTLIIASAIALSSTAIVTKELALRNQVATAHGNMAIGILLFQDIAAIVMLVLISVGADLGNSQILSALGMAGVKALLFFVAVVAIGKWLLPPLLVEIGKSRSEELFVLVVLVIALTAAAAAHVLGLSMALGAFMAGMMLGESHFRHQIEAEIRPFRDVLLGIFFVSIGLIVDLDLIASYWLRIAFFALCLVVFKTLLIAALCKIFGSDLRDSLRTGLILCQGGEFGFALLALAVKDQLIPKDMASFFLAIIVFSMALTPLLISRSHLIADRLLARGGVKPENHSGSDIAAGQEHELKNHVILCGYGRVGQIIGRFLKMENIPYVAVDDDPVRVQRALALGEQVVFGNARKIKLLQQLGLADATLVVISFDDPMAARTMVEEIRQLRDRIPVLVRTRDDSFLQELQQAGASEVIPETLEASLMLVSHVMAALGLPAAKVFDTVRQVREERYSMLHGFIVGEKVGSELPNQLQPIFLPRDARAVGKTLEQLALQNLNIRIHTLRRGDKTLSNPGAATVLEANDIVVLGGEASAIEKAESYLLSGS
ncbi:MAG: cation:proton antiporter [Porticoccaceae bacterium]